MLLQLGKTADHEGVLKVGGDHLLEQLHVVGAELAETLVHVAAELAVALAAIFLQTLGKHKGGMAPHLR